MGVATTYNAGSARVLDFAMQRAPAFLGSDGLLPLYLGAAGLANRVT
jgi:hypothetical protein